MGENILRLKAREAIQGGHLPVRRPERMWGGPGNGALCGLCGIPLQQHEVGLEVEFARDPAPGQSRSYAFHVRCFEAWELELPLETATVLSGELGDSLLPGQSLGGTMQGGGDARPERDPP